MGNVLAFQYSPAADSKARQGVLRFFRVEGVGTSMACSISIRFFADEGSPGPNVILAIWHIVGRRLPAYIMSSIPLKACCMHPEKTVAAIAEGSRFRYEPVVDAENRQG
jgi:hypothetical protein